MNESRERHQRTLSDWTRTAIRTMLRSPDPIGVYSQQDEVIKDCIRMRLGQYRRASPGTLLPIVLLGVAVAIVIPAPVVFLPLAGVALVLAFSWHEDRLARLNDTILTAGEARSAA
jgi:hypothetical protein